VTATLQDMAPYVGLLMPELQAAVVDPLPEVRATAARALGSLLRGMGAEHFADLVPWLLATLRSEVRCWYRAFHVCLPPLQVANVGSAGRLPVHCGA
jgi:hypothetical protein